MSCKPRTVYDKILNLETVNMDFDVSDFYGDKVARTENTISKDPKDLGKEETLKLLDENFFGKDTLYNIYDDPDTVIGAKRYNEKRQVLSTFGYNYITVSWNKEDSLAVLNGIYFQKLDMMESKKGEFLAMQATNETTSENKNQINLTNYFNKKYGKAKHSFESNPEKEQILNWENAKELIILRIKVDTMQSVLSTSADGKQEIEKTPEYSIDYFKFNKTHLNSIRKIRDGDWSIAHKNEF
ncbi:hypothetical protein [Pedobacter metabolipauper]|uniref:Uncharacterized protein n=1 Tax=Pedobacter metabolipauper TaxID=425513 RepID=A0A4R6T137_9SPHI|nr:hypothetical protein [Pedobacter metabolipauper]TDQ11769.1 hypothetical protein ATK78_0897 [Pedobacter metabolipauper]